MQLEVEIENKAKKTTEEEAYDVEIKNLTKIFIEKRGELNVLKELVKKLKE